jgi:hypothetical protein
MLVFCPQGKRVGIRNLNLFYINFLANEYTLSFCVLTRQFLYCYSHVMRSSD